MSFDKSLLQITLSSFDEAADLHDAVGSALQKSSMNISVKNIDTENPINSELSENAFGEVIKTLLSVTISKEVRNCLFVCCKRVLYNKEKVDKDFFDKVENRSLYYPIMMEVAKDNLKPFIESLSSQFGGLAAIIKSIQK